MCLSIFLASEIVASCGRSSAQAPVSCVFHIRSEPEPCTVFHELGWQSSLDLRQNSAWYPYDEKKKNKHGSPCSSATVRAVTVRVEGLGRSPHVWWNIRLLSVPCVPGQPATENNTPASSSMPFPTSANGAPHRVKWGAPCWPQNAARTENRSCKRSRTAEHHAMFRPSAHTPF